LEGWKGRSVEVGELYSIQDGFFHRKEKENLFFIEEFTVWLLTKIYLGVSRYIILSSYEISFLLTTDLGASRR